MIKFLRFCLKRPRFIPSRAVNSNSVDMEEILHHNTLAATWWDISGGSVVPLHSMNQLRLPFIQNALINENKLTKEDLNKPNCLNGLKFLDIGCGAGIVSLPLAKQGGNITGIDPSTELINLAKVQAEQKLSSDCTLKFLDTTIEEHSLTHANHYDVIILSEVIEHVTRRDMLMKASIDTLKPGGLLILSTINRTIKSLFGAVLIAEMLNIIPRGTHKWSKLVKPSDVNDYLKLGNCTLKEIRGMKYNPKNNTWKWTTNLGLHYILFAVKS